MISQKELDVLNTMPMEKFINMNKDNGLVLELNDGKISDYKQEYSDYDMEME